MVPDLPIESRTIGHVLRLQAERQPDAPFMLNGDRVFTYADTDRLSSQLARGFRRWGIRPGDRVALMLENSPEYVLSLFALNKIGDAIHITTGRRLTESFPENADSVVVMLDGELAFKTVEDQDTHIYWGAYLGTGDEIILSGRLGDVAGEIERVRRQAREKKGWLMDTYLLRKER